MGNENLAEELAALLTEQRNPRTRMIDNMSIESILRIMNEEDATIARAVGDEIPYIAEAVQLIVESFLRGGRLFYVGAGTSGRLGVLDAAECPPTFGTSPDMVTGIIAGGPETLWKSIEGVEDDEEQGRRDLEKNGARAGDVVCGLAASRRTPYVVAAIRKAEEIGAKTIYVTTNPRSEFNLKVDVAICPEVGPEVIMGSTRLKSGTAQKLVLNMLSTATMIRLGKVYENMMVDLQLNSKKLEERAKRVIMMATGAEYKSAERSLQQAGGHVKTAIVMLLAGLSPKEAKERLSRAGGFVREAIKK